MSGLPEHGDQEHRTEHSEAHHVDPVDVEGVEPAADAGASPADVFEHLARIRSGISDGVITPW